LLFKINKAVSINTSTVKQKEAKNKNLFNIYVIKLTIYDKLSYILKVKIAGSILRTLYILIIYHQLKVIEI